MLRSGRYMDGVPTLLVRYWCIMPEYLVARSFFFKVAGLGGTSSPYHYPSFIHCDH